MFSAIGSIIGGIMGASSAAKDRKLQIKFAKNGIQWRAADARAAGIHPLAALGAQTPTYTPVGDGGLGSAIAQGASAMGDTFANTQSSKAQKPIIQSQLEVNKAQADLLRAQTVSTLANVTAGVRGGVGGKVPTADPQKAEDIYHNGQKAVAAYVPFYDPREGNKIIGYGVNPVLYGDFSERVAPHVVGPIERQALTPAGPGRKVEGLPSRASRGERVELDGVTYVYHPRLGWQPVRK